MNVLREWNCNWNPPFFLSDFSEAEFSALKQSFPIVQLSMVVTFTGNRHGHGGYKTGKMVNGLDRSDADCLLDLLRACAWAPPGTDDSVLEVNYLKAVSVLKESAVWKTNVHVQNWLTANWLRITGEARSRQGNFPT